MISGTNWQFLQFLVGGYDAPFWFDRNKNGGGIMLHVCVDISAKLLSHDFPFIKGFVIEINLPKRNGLIVILK